MKTQIVLTVDTEPSIAGAFDDPERYAPLLHEPVSGEVASKSEALGFILETLGRFQFRATFFVEALNTRYFPESVMGGYVEKLRESGQDIQLHIHPNWARFKNGEYDPNCDISDNCSDLDADLLASLMDEGASQIAAWTGRRPTAFRPGNFATNLKVFDAMVKAGLTVSSNICLAVRPPSEPELALWGGRHLIEGVREFPVTCFADRGPVGRGRPRPLQITALSAGEMRAVLKQVHRNRNGEDGSIAVIVTHPFEFIKKGDFRYSRIRPNRLVQGRLRSLCEFLQRESDRFEVVTLEEAATGSSNWNASPPRLEGAAHRALFRAGQNYLNDLVQ